MFVNRLLPLMSIFLLCNSQTHAMLSTNLRNVTRTHLTAHVFRTRQTAIRDFSSNQNENKPLLSFGQTLVLAVPLSILLEKYQEEQKKKRYLAWRMKKYKPAGSGDYPPASER